MHEVWHCDATSVAPAKANEMLFGKKKLTGHNLCSLLFSDESNGAWGKGLTPSEEFLVGATLQQQHWFNKRAPFWYFPHSFPPNILTTDAAMLWSYQFMGWPTVICLVAHLFLITIYKQLGICLHAAREGERNGNAHLFLSQTVSIIHVHLGKHGTRAARLQPNFNPSRRKRKISLFEGWLSMVHITHWSWVSSP